MRITSGLFRGRRLKTPLGRDIRPTSERARQAVFDMLVNGPRYREHPLAGATVLDLFAGTGAMGLEALSRGAAAALFLETAPAALSCLDANIAALGVGDHARVLRRDATKPGPAVARASHAFLDPPYGSDAPAHTLAGLADGGWLDDGAIIVLEHGRTEDPPIVDGFSLLEQRRHGAARLDLLRFRSPD